MERSNQERAYEKFQEWFQTDEACRAHLFSVRWPDGFVCPACGNNHFYDVPKRKKLQCKACGHQTSVTADTEMHRTRTSLTLWFWGIYWVANGLSSATELSEKLNFSYITALRMLKKIKLG
ncbi:MAG: transposase, partial [Deltaproteobacteria bacterium]|nr:transposase [Deltaproteobacteria bacterium]